MTMGTTTRSSRSRRRRWKAVVVVNITLLLQLLAFLKLVESSELQEEAFVADPQNNINGNSTGFCQTFVVSTSGYDCSEYMVETSDGYLLALQRITTTAVLNAAGAAAQPRRPAFLYHGIMEGGEIWLLNPSQEVLPFMLAHAGYEVWIANTRTSNYTFGHITYNLQDKKYWDWNWDDLVSKDLPSMLQFVHTHAQQQPIFYVGFSQGAMTAFAAFSQSPSLVNLVAKATMLSPVSHVNHITSPVLLAAVELLVDKILLAAGLSEFGLNSEAGVTFMDILCTSPQVDCTSGSGLLSQITGPNCCLNETRMPVYNHYGVQPTSVQNVVQMVQLVRSGRFGMYDYGLQGNLAMYHVPSPPEYDLSAIPPSLPILLAYGGNDAIADPNDVANLISLLRGVPEVFYVPNYAHGDFVLGTNAGTVLYNHILSFFEA